MNRRKIFAPGCVVENALTLTGRELNLVKNALRVSVGDALTVTDGTFEYTVRITEITRSRLAGIVLSRLAPAEKEAPLELAFGCVRPDPMEQILRHGVELGVTRFIPVIASRCARRPEERKERWSSIVASAMSQSGRITAPVVEGPTTYAAVLAAPKPGFMKRILIPGPYPSLLEVGDFSAPALLLIGPEGGFTESEEQAAFTAGFSPAALSGSSLRAETAALCAAAIVAAARYAADRRETALAPR